MLDTGTVPAVAPIRQIRRLDRLTLASLIVGIFATAVSATGSWIPSLWGDEGASVLSATRPFPSLLAMLTHVDAVHGLYYIGLHAWVDVFGSSPFSVRLPSAIAIGVTAAFVTALCGRFGSVAFAICAGIFAAILPRLTYAGEEARSYAFDAAIATVIVFLLAEIMLRRGESSGRLWIAYSVMVAIGIYAFLYLGLMMLVAGAALWLTPSLRHQLRSWAIASGAAVAASLPLLVFAFIERNQIAFLSHRDVITADAIFVQMWFGAIVFAVIAWALIILGTAGYLADAVHERRPGLPATPRLELIALAWLVIPVALLILMSVIEASYTARYGTFAAPAAAVMMAFGVRRLRQIHWLPPVAAVLVVVAAVPIWMSQRTPYAKNESDWNQIATTIHDNAVAGDAVVFDNAVRPSRRPRLAMDTNPAAFTGLQDVTLKTPFAENKWWYSEVHTVKEAAALGRFRSIDRVWVVEYAIDGSGDKWGMADLAALGFRKVEQFDGHRSLIYLYEK
jgi:mannosyltransferase